MLTITIICNLGMSTSMLVKRIIDYAKEKGIESDVDAVPFDKMDERIKKTDILLIGPQVRHLYKKMTTEHGDKIPVIQVMDMSSFALLKADKIFDEAYKEYTAKTAK